MPKKMKRILIVNHATKQYTLFRVIAEQTVPIQHETVIPQVEAFHVHHDSIVLHQVVPAEPVSPAPAPKPAPPFKAAMGPANTPKAAPGKKRGRPPGKKNSKPPKPVKLSPDHELLLTRALEAHQADRDGLPSTVIHTWSARKLVALGLLECFTPDDSFMEWYRLTQKGIERARLIEDSWL